MTKVIKNEKQFAEWFKENYKKLGYSGMVRGDIARCPDFIMMRDGKEVGVELETIASNFLVHRHSPNKVDEVLCIIKDVNLPVYIKEVKELEFQGKQKVTLSIDSNVYRGFQKHCDEKGFLLSKKVELFMEEKLKSKEGKE